jgi:hypothetical protein
MIIRKSTINSEVINNTNEVVYLMSDAAILAASVKTTLLEVAKQSNALGTGLQNAAPGGSSSPNNSVNYLLAISEEINALVEKFPPSS